ncbi:hypothetical protein [Eisenibacter elegans]|uniref:hypothetical protein n=1 Tax=Eisenibacter elegans TaxID=997 RepID=UPI00042A61AA|nr:hypothetical protein [Eisenibacter elegans]
MNTNPTTNTNQELSLVDLFIKIIRVWRRHRQKLPIAIILSIVGFGSAYFAFSPVYTTSMVVSSKELSYLTANPIIETLRELIREKNYEELGRRLNLTAKEAALIYRIKASPLLQNPMELERVRIYQNREEAAPREAFVVEVKVHKNEVLPKLQDGLLKYFEQNTYVKTRREIDNKNRQALINRIEAEIAAMDTLKTALNQAVTRTQTGVNLINPGEIFEKSAYLKRFSLQLEKDIALSQDLQVIEAFTQYSKPSSFDLKKTLALGLLAGILVWIIWVLVVELKRLIQRAESLIG